MEQGVATAVLCIVGGPVLWALVSIHASIATGERENQPQQGLSVPFRSTATAPVASTWEDFEVIRNANGTVSFRARVSGNLVTADAGAPAPNTSKLIANRRAIDVEANVDGAPRP